MFPGKKKRIMTFFNARFGKDPADSAEALRCRDRLPQIRILNDTLSDTGEGNPYGVDEITWTDLEMDEVFLRINQTGSYIGEQVLYQTLHNGSETFFRENRDWMNTLSEDRDLLQELVIRFYPIGKRQESYYLPKFFADAGLMRPEHSWVFRVLQLILAVSALSAFIFRSTPFYVVLALSVIINFIVYLMMKMRYDVLLSSMSGIGQILELYEWAIRNKEIPQPEGSDVRDTSLLLRKLRKKIGILIYTKRAGLTGDIFGLLFDYILGITLMDVARIDGILKMIDENWGAVTDAFTYVGRLDAAISILSFRNSLPDWSLPELTAQGEIVSHGLYHPLIREPVMNDFTLYDRAILTGANASGKSTFMKSLAVNAILAQTIDTACCTSLSMPQLKVMTSMAIRDDVVSGESYYVREVRYLKRMLDEIGQGTMTLYVIDEILKGTNQKERLAASEAVLKYLTHFPGFCMIATHDIELVNKLQEMYAPYYFESHITENNVTFDYCIHPGRGGESNALALLRAFGFPDEIIQDANQTISSL